MEGFQRKCNVLFTNMYRHKEGMNPGNLERSIELLETINAAEAPRSCVDALEALLDFGDPSKKHTLRFPPCPQLQSLGFKNWLLKGTL